MIEAKYIVVKSAKFKKGYKLAQKQGNDLSVLPNAVRPAGQQRY